MPLTITDAVQIETKLDYKNIYMLSAALNFFKSVKALSDRHNNVRILCTFFVMEAFVNVLKVDQKEDPYKKFAWLLKEYLNDDEMITLLCGFVFSDYQELDASEHKPLYHIMRRSVISDRDYLCEYVLGLAKHSRYQEGRERGKRIEEEKRLLSEYVNPIEKTDLITGRNFWDYKECIAPCDCKGWLRKNVAKTDEFLDELANKIYNLRNSIAHHGFPVHFSVDNEINTMIDRIVFRSKSGNLKALSFAVKIPFTDLTSIFEGCLARALLAF